VLSLILLVLLIWVVVSVLLAAWTLFYQGYIYTEPATGIHWRAPAAGSAITAVILLWMVLDYRVPGGYRPLHEFESNEDKKPYPELRIPTAEGGETVYKLQPGRGLLQYRLDSKLGGRHMPSSPQKIIAFDGEEKLIFERQPPPPRGWLSLKRGSDEDRYVARDSKGREHVMLGTNLGQETAFRTGRFFANLLLNFLFLAVWFVALWLLLRFGWPAALGQAVVFWGVFALFVLPPVLTRAEDVARARGVQKAPPGR
jgi:hypothetical protein